MKYTVSIAGPGMWNAARERLTEVVGRLVPGMFRKQSLQHMRDFKAFAEHGTDVRGTAS